MATIRPITSNVSDLLVNAYTTNLSTPSYIGDTSLSVYSILNFAINNILLIGGLGSEGSEIVNTHSSTAPSGNTITLATSLTKDHSSDIRVYSLPYNKIEFSTSTTLTGAKSVLGLVSIDPENEVTVYNDSAGSVGYYFTRYYNSITSTYSDYSDPIPVDGFESDTVGYIIDIAMKESQKDFTNKLTYEGLVREINECLRFVRGKLKRWSSSEAFNVDLGSANRGVYRLPLPSDYYNPNTNASCLDVRVGNQYHLRYVDKQEFDDLMIDVAHSTVVSTTTIGSTSLILSSTDGFPDDGTINVYVNNTALSISYTANDTSTGTLTGVSGITSQIPAGTDAWYGITEGTPFWFTIFEGYLYWWYPADETVVGRSVTIDYYTDIVKVDSDSDVIPLTRFDMIKHWLKWHIRNITERNGRPDLTDQDFQLFNSLLQDAIRRESTGQKFKMKPKVNGIIYKGRFGPVQDYESYLRS